MKSSRDGNNILEIIEYVNTLYDIQRDYHKEDPRYKALDYAISCIGTYAIPFMPKRNKEEGVQGVTGSAY